MVVACPPLGGPGGRRCGCRVIRMEEHFSEPEPNMIESSAGFSVRVLGRTGMRYTEGERSVWIDSEVLATPRAIAMFKESMQAWEGPGPAEVSAAERDRITGNIKRAFDACGYDLQVQEPFDWGSVALRPPHQPGELLISRLRHAGRRPFRSQLAFQFHAELCEERDGGVQVLDEDSDVVHPLNEAMPPRARPR